MIKKIVKACYAIFNTSMLGLGRSIWETPDFLLNKCEIPCPKDA